MTTATVIVIGYSAVVVAFTAAILRVVRRMPEHEEQQRVDAARELVGLLPPAADNRPGLDAEALDACELIWAEPAWHPGFDRLRQAIRDEQQKGDL